MSPTLHVGFDNYVLSDKVLALLDSRTAAIRRLVRNLREKAPETLLNVTCGRKAYTLIILTNSTYILSAIPRKRLAKRLGIITESE